MKLTIELPEKLEEALNLFCQVCEAFLEEKQLITELTESKPVTELTELKPIPIKQIEQPKQEKPRATELPSDEDFAKLPLPEMEKIMVNPKNLNAFRFRAFARCARQIYGKKVEELAQSINPDGINGILKGKHKNQAAKFIDCVINTNFSTEEKSDNDIPF